MSARTRRRAVAAAVVASLAALGPDAAAAQEPEAPAGGPVRGGLGLRYLALDSVTVRLRTRSLWRGFDLGRAPLGGAVDVDLWRIDGIRDRHALTARVAGDVPLAARDRPARTDLFEAGAGYRYRLDTEQGEATVGVVGRRFAGQPGRQFSPELAAAVQRRVDVPVTELRPLLTARVARDLRRFDATYFGPSAMLDAGLPSANGAVSVGGRLVAGTTWSDYPKRRAPRGPLGHHDTTFEIVAYYDRATTAVGPLVAEVGLAQWWTSVGTRPRHTVATVRVVKR
jgi:hypothetical protein